jgi:uncharacterized membrane protein YcaP (DUF421 family)
LFHNNVDLLEIVARSTIVYFVILVGLRIGGKREIGQMTAFDLAVILLIANAVQNAMVGSDVSVTAGATAAAVLFAENYAVGFLRERWPWLRKLLEGEPTLLVQDGKYIEENMEREDIDEEMVEMSMREHGIQDLGQVKLATLETDGSISVVPKDARVGKRKVRKRSRWVRRG